MEIQKIKNIYAYANMLEDNLLKEINREKDENKLKTMIAIKKRLVSIQRKAQGILSLMEGVNNERV